MNGKEEARRGERNTGFDTPSLRGLTERRRPIRVGACFLVLANRKDQEKRKRRRSVNAPALALESAVGGLFLRWWVQLDVQPALSPSPRLFSLRSALLGFDFIAWRRLGSD